MNYEYLFLFYGSPYMLKHDVVASVCLLIYVVNCAVCALLLMVIFFFFLLLTTAIMCFHAAD